MHNAAGHAYILGGSLCYGAQMDNCTTTSSVEMLNMSAGAWQRSSALLGRAADGSQIAVLDLEFGMWQRTNDTVNDCLFRRMRPFEHDDEYELHQVGLSSLCTFELSLGRCGNLCRIVPSLKWLTRLCKSTRTALRSVVHIKRNVRNRLSTLHEYHDNAQQHADNHRTYAR